MTPRERRIGKDGWYARLLLAKNPSSCQGYHDARDRVSESLELAMSMEHVWSGSAMSMPELEANGGNLAHLARSVNEGTTVIEFLHSCEFDAKAWLRHLPNVWEVACSWSRIANGP